ncbi:DUF262 domain-containing protein [Altererythrobacter sp. H2]|uniref:DUF262 domain-containing protein n=1 Tax=Altererythrobacter sp. H2 TaxID=3108391 RepID=UPI002B4BB02F|nr:DUF262 domain-containing protein [Altererythrobacter sp. H2]WRK94455.1 DUF262 domain-containing protein [Altererythrobacter sp. H2]
MVHWNISPHPIADVRDWSDAGRLELQPDFQRREVWAQSAKIMLIDSILSDIPLPKIFLAKTIKGGSVHRVVIDGQQRISTILAFLRDEFHLESPYIGPFLGKRFSDFNEDETDKFLRYRIDFNEADNPSDREVRDVYMRVNKYTVPLTRQELRRADYPGDFLDVAEELSVAEFFEDAGVFTATDRRRYADAEYVSEILAALIGGIQDKKDTLDDFYITHTSWPADDRKAIIKRFKAVIADLSKIFEGWRGGIKGTRFRQKADFYSLFVAIDELLSDGHALGEKPLDALINDLRGLDDGIRPEADVDILSEYAIKCVSQANSASSRRWRADFLKAVIGGTYRAAPPTGDERKIFYRIMDDYTKADGGGMCPPTEHDCPACNEAVDQDDGALLAWGDGEVVFQTYNVCWIHPDCATEPGWRVIHRPSEADDDQPDLL